MHAVNGLVLSAHEGGVGISCRLYAISRDGTQAYAVVSSDYDVVLGERVFDEELADALIEVAKTANTSSSDGASPAEQAARSSTYRDLVIGDSALGAVLLWGLWKTLPRDLALDRISTQADGASGQKDAAKGQVSGVNWVDSLVSNIRPVAMGAFLSLGTTTGCLALAAYTAVSSFLFAVTTRPHYQRIREKYEAEHGPISNTGAST